MKAKLYTIEKFGAFGEGVARDDGKTVFIKGALPGEKVLASVTLDKKTFSVARLKKVLAPSEFRIVPPCKYFGVCGGCSLQHLDYSEQLRLKSKTVQETLLKVGGIEIEPPEIVASDKIYGYRNKLSYPVSGEKIGLYAENSHDIVDLDNCLLQREWNVSLISALRKFMSDYPEVKDEIRHMVAREKDGGVCVALVAYKKINIKPFADYLPFGDFALYLNVNASRNNVILSDEFYLAATKGNAPKFHPASFYQVNDYIADRLYGDVSAKVDGDVIVDAYCGAGDLTIRLSAAAKRTIGVEICAQAVQEARQKAKANQITNAEFICGDCKKILPEIFNNIDGEITVVFDPPRKGLDPDIISSGKALSPEKIIYISCNPSTLARDLKLLSDRYDIANIILYDMFPNTPHVETMIVLQRK